MSTLKILRNWAETRAAHGDRTALPPEAYTSEELAALERKHLFQRGWIVVAHVSQLCSAGDYITYNLANHPIVVARGRDRVLRAFSNVCAHRSAIIAKGSGNRTVFQCPYHAWTYDLAGKLIAAPHMEREAVSGIRLKRLGLEVWHGLVFVNLYADAPPLAPDLDGLGSVTAPYRIAEHRVVMCEDMEIACNWKLFIENFCESYHVFSVHPETLEPGTATTSTEILPGGTGYNHHLMMNGSETLRVAAGRLGLPSNGPTPLHILCFYPASAISFDSGEAVLSSVVPTGVNTSRVRLWRTVLPDVDGTDSQEQAERSNAAIRTFMAEDRAVIEGMQKGLAAGTGNHAPQHPWETTNWEFAQYLMRRLGIVLP
ncbi:MAG: aromatic ring-hydroxylating dioxygenase subunit alpha [Alphaproteobacteria bacterium]|nr:aromatic ring-hydroxylating dioxygenase subunit alpha [Rhodospirillaceae bacterium]MBT7612361.1 aromatic ring-hydroxylating dioxygenase subunit alpha [Rhodospirillaceae bacterium]MDG2481006.1 aromatic ring-hydroxylating dioxygenase subunit alpha [Alphaproteobacteria bacterium]